MLLLAGVNVYAADLQKVQVHGFISQGYMISSDTNTDLDDGTFEFNEFGINGMIRITDNLRAGMQLLSRDLMNDGNNDIKLDWAYADYSYHNWLGMRAGKMKMKYGLYSQSRDIDAARTSIFLPGSIYNEVRRDIVTSITGAGIYGLLPGNVTYEFQIGSLDMDSVVDGMDSDSDNVAFGLEWETPLEGLKTGISYNTAGGASNTITLDVKTVTFSGEYIRDNFRIAAEYGQTDTDMRAGTVVLADRTNENYYVDAGYRFTDWFELGAYYSVSYEDMDDRDGDRYRTVGKPEALAWIKDFALSARFDINEYWIVKIEGHAMDGLKGVNFGDETDPDDNWFLFAAKTTVSF